MNQTNNENEIFVDENGNEIKQVNFLENYVLLEDGRIYNKNRKHFLKPSVADSLGYYRVNIGGKVCYIHRLIADAFVENPKNENCVTHIDGNRQNNKASNLKWMSKSESIKSYYSGLKEGTIQKREVTEKERERRRKMNQSQNYKEYQKRWHAAKKEKSNA